MLVLSRKRDQVIVIGPPENPIARIVIVDIKGGSTVRVGIVADRNVTVLREELCEPEANGTH